MAILKTAVKGQNKKSVVLEQNMDRIYREYAQTIYGFLLSRTHDQEISEELTQETFYQAIRASEQYNGDSSVLTWLCSIAKYQWYNYCRKQKVRERFSYDFIEESEESVEQQVMAKLIHREVLERLNQLEDPMREVMNLRIYGELSFRQIGEIFQKSENWARVTFYRGKEKVAKEVKRDET